ncbi:antirestriction Ral family protein, partial [Escherichia coli]
RTTAMIARELSKQNNKAA